MAAYIASQAAGGSGALPSENTSMATEAEFVAAVAALARGLCQFDIVMGEEGRKAVWVCDFARQGRLLYQQRRQVTTRPSRCAFLGAWLPSTASARYGSWTLLTLGCSVLVARRHICRHLHLSAHGAGLCLSERQQRRQHLCSGGPPSLVLCPAQLQRPERQRSGHAGAGWAGALWAGLRRLESPRSAGGGHCHMLLWVSGALPLSLLWTRGVHNLASRPAPRLQAITNLTGAPVECASLPPAWQVQRSWINNQASGDGGLGWPVLCSSMRCVWADLPCGQTLYSSACAAHQPSSSANATNSSAGLLRLGQQRLRDAGGAEGVPAAGGLAGPLGRQCQHPVSWLGSIC